MTNRRQWVQQSLAVASLLATSGFLPKEALAYDTKAFQAKSVAGAFKALGIEAPQESSEVSITTPDIAENGAVVPMTVATTLGNVKKMLILVEKNPSPLAAEFTLTPEVEARFQTRARMGQSSDIYGVAITNDGKAYFAKKETKVTLGGCGG